MTNITIMNKKFKFYCDKCYTNKLNSDGDGKEKVYFATTTTEKWCHHLDSKKHKKALAEEPKDDDILCKICNTYFSKEQYEIHKKRNKEMWPLADILGLKCNHFVLNGVRYCSYEDMKNSRMKKEKNKIIMDKEDLEDGRWGIVKESDDEAEDYSSDDSYVEAFVFYDYCNECGHPINNVGYKKKELKSRGHIVCECYNENEYDTDELLNNNNFCIKV